MHVEEAIRHPSNFDAATLALIRHWWPQEPKFIPMNEGWIPHNAHIWQPETRNQCLECSLVVSRMKEES